LPSNSPHGPMILRVDLVGSHGRWKRPCRWKVDESTHTITLEGLLALCPNCHQAKHLVQNKLIAGGEAQVLTHLQRINNWSQVETDAYVAYVERCVCARAALPVPLLSPTCRSVLAD
jgi:hypothetical protein